MPVRVIVVDDEADDREWCVGALEAQDYLVFAPSDTNELFHMLESVNPHCVLCDHYLDGDHWGFTGIELAEELGGPIPWVLMTKRPLDVRSMERVWQPDRGRSAKIQRFYNKLEPLSRLLEIMQDVISTYIPLNFALDILPKDTASIINVVEPELLGSAGSGAIEQLRENVNDLLRMLFRAYDSVYIKREIYKGDGLCLLHVGAEAGQGPADNLLLLCGRKAPVCAALSAYSTYGRANGMLGRIDSRERLNVAGVTFAFGGNLAQVRQLSELWLNRPPAQTGALLERLIADQLSLWPLQSGERATGPEALGAACAHLGLRPERLDPAAVEQRLQAFCRAASRSMRISYSAAERRIELTARDGRLHACPLPGDALAQLERLGAGWTAWCGPIYGAPHPDQVLVDEQRGQLIHWYYGPLAERGPRLLYFALLERHMKATMREGGPLDHYELERALVAAEEGRPGPQLAPAMQTAFEALLALRRAVAVLLELESLRPYYAVLLLCTLQSMRPGEPASRVSESELHAFLASLVLADQLLSAAAPARAQEGLSIDPNSGEVTVDGVRVEEHVRITPQDRRFLNYLYKHHDQLCTYEAILRDFYQCVTAEELERLSPAEWEDLLRREKPRIDATLNRLRAIIEPASAAPDENIRRKSYRYLVTRPRVGVMLRLRPAEGAP